MTKQHTNEEIIAEVTRIYSQLFDAYIYDLLVEVTVNTPESVRIKISDMYSAPPMNSELIFALCEFFDTKHINDVDRWTYGGCETCDWGSSYGFELEVLP